MKTFDAYAQYYDLLYKDKDYQSESAYTNRLIKAINPEAKSLLNLGCGTGKHDLHFLNQGYDVVGIDLSPGMIQEANAFLSKDIAAGKASFREGDVRTIRLNRKFDAVVSLFHVISYQTLNSDITSMLETVAAHLPKGGIFVFDCWYGPAVLTDKPVVRVKRLENEYISVTRIAEPVIHPNENLVDVNYEVLIQDKKDSANRQLVRETHTMRYLFLPEIEFFLQKAGFEIVKKEEWMTGNEPGLNSWNIVVICKYNP